MPARATDVQKNADAMVSGPPNRPGQLGFSDEC
jgi:hypothetical protein